MLSYACCLALAASAVTIDSPEVGKFFKLPDWAPAEVDSEHTPGSPETVVDVYSNAVKTTEWDFGAIRWFPSNSMYAVSFSPTNAVQPTYVKGRGWDLSASIGSLARIVPDAEGSDTYTAPGGSVVAADEGAGSLTISVHYHAARKVDGVWQDLQTDFTWTLTAKKQEVSPVNTGRKAVRPFRLVPERFSSFYATFEAYYERLYYMNCGSRNVWNESEWGPRTADHLFRFDMPTNYPEHSSFYEPQTNRTVRTRRLIESDNLVRFYEHVRDMDAWYWPERPSWSNYHYAAWRSTTVFDDMGLSVEWPNLILWGAPGSVLGQLTSEQWERTMLTFEDVRKAPPDPTRTFQLDWTTGGDWFSNARGAWDQVNFGEPPFNDSVIYDWMLRPSFTDLEKSVTNTTEDVLAYPWGDRSLVTNDFITTRRLIPGSWGRANQVLACYDRSYYSPPFENMSVTGAYQRAEQSRQYLRTGKEPIVVSVGGDFYEDGQGGLYAVARGSASIPAPTRDDMIGEYTNVTTEAVSRQYPVAYSSPTDAGGEVWLDESSYYSPDDLWAFAPLDHIADATIQYIPAGQERECFPGELYVFVGCWDGIARFGHSIGIWTGSEMVYAQGRIGLSPVPIARFGVGYTMEKSHENVQIGRLDQSTIGDPVPGDFSRVAGGGFDDPGCSLHILLSSAIGSGKENSPVSADTPVPSPLSYYEFMHGSYARDDDQWLSRYIAYTSKYSDATGYRDAIDEAYSKIWTQCSSKVDEALGPRWRDSARMTAIGEDEVMYVFSGLSITNGMRIGWHFEGNGGNYLDLPDSPWPNQILISVTVRNFDGQFAEIVKITYMDIESGETVEATDETTIALARVRTIADWYTVDIPGHHYEQSHGAISDGKLWGIARVDWSWNCLRLNKDE